VKSTRNYLKQFSKIAGLVIFALMLLISPPAMADTDQAACYGETLEVSLLSLSKNDGRIRERTVFALPSPNAWLVISEGGEHLHDMPCQDEPIDVSKIWGGFIDARMGHGDFGVPGIDGVRVRWLRLSGAGAEISGRIEQFFISETVSNGVLFESGFYHQIGQNTTATGGGWVFPEAYQSPIGTKIHMGCTGTCRVEYRIFSNLNLAYELLLDDENTIPDWIAIDRYVRSVILSWIVEDE